jgi:hypothetical protein
MFERPILLWLLLATPLIVWPAMLAARADRPIAALCSTFARFLAQTSAGPPGVYTAIGSQTAVTFDRKTSMIDTTDKSTAEKQFMAGLREETITLGNLG